WACSCGRPDTGRLLFGFWAGTTSNRGEGAPPTKALPANAAQRPQGRRCMGLLPGPALVGGPTPGRLLWLLGRHHVQSRRGRPSYKSAASQSSTGPALKTKTGPEGPVFQHTTNNRQQQDSDDALGQHGVGDFHEACDVGAFHIV